MAARRLATSKRVLMLICLLPLGLGCGARAGAVISGQVTLDGAPLDEANITFVPTTGGQSQAAWTTVKGGAYAITANEGLGVGAFRVEIRALRASSQKANPNDPTLISAIEAVPAKYNSRSELKVEIKSGANTADFALKSK